MPEKMGSKGEKKPPTWDRRDPLKIKTHRKIQTPMIPSFWLKEKSWRSKKKNWHPG